MCIKEIWGMGGGRERMRGYGDNEPGPEVRDPKRKNIFHKDPCWDVREDIDVCS